MGYNSTILILNDRLHEIENDPEFGKKVANAIRSHHYRDDRQPYITGQTTVIDVAHADVMQILAVGGNCGRVIGYSGWTSEDDDIIKGLNQDRLARAREAKKKS